MKKSLKLTPVLIKQIVCEEYNKIYARKQQINEISDQAWGSVQDDVENLADVVISRILDDVGSFDTASQKSINSVKRYFVKNVQDCIKNLVDELERFVQKPDRLKNDISLVKTTPMWTNLKGQR